MQLGTVYAAGNLTKPGAQPVPGYRLIGRLGRGGFGEVWKAEAPGGFQVALKFVRVSEGSAGTAELRALEITKAIRHPNLLSCFGAWVVDDVLIIGMELADRTLWDRYRESIDHGLAGIPRDELIDNLTEAARGIDHLNEHKHTLEGKELVGVQHRDIKPQNILLVGGGVKVADFGMVRLLDHSVASHTGSWTFAYAAPEFFKKQTARQSDQYCLAVTYCHLRGGRLPFTGSAAQTMAGHLMGPPDLTMLPGGERPVLARALAKEPKERWANCRTFVEALRTSSPEGDPAVPLPVPALAPASETEHPSEIGSWRFADLGTGDYEYSSDRESVSSADDRAISGRETAVLAARPRRRDGGTTRKLVKAGASAVLVATAWLVLWCAEVAAPAGSTPPANLAAEPVRPATSPNPTGPIERATAVPEPMALQVSTHPETPSVTAIARVDLSRGAVNATSAIERNSTEPVATTARGEASGQVKFESRVERENKVIPAPRPKSLALRMPESLTLTAGETTTLPVRVVRDGVAGDVAVRFEGAGPGVAPLDATIVATSDEARLPIRVPVDAREDEGLIHVSGSIGSTRAEADVKFTVKPMAALVHDRRGGEYLGKGEYPRAIAHYTEAIRLKPDAASVRSGRGLAYFHLGEYDRAIADYSEAIRLDPKDPVVFNNRGLAYRENGDYFKAISDYDEAIRLKPNDAVVHYNRGLAYFHLERHAEAIDAFTKAIQLGMNDARAYKFRGEAHARRNDQARALADLNEAARLEAEAKRADSRKVPRKVRATGPRPTVTQAASTVERSSE